MYKTMYKTKRKAWILFTLLVCLCARASAQAISSPGTSQITLLDAVRSVLSNHPLLKSQQAQIEISRGLQQQASATFDLVTQTGLLQGRSTLPLSAGQQEENLLSGIDGSSQRLNLTDYGFSVSKEFRNGISVAPRLDLIRNTDNLFNASGLNTSALSFTINVPLMRDRGRSVVGAQEDAAKLGVNATLLDLNHLISQLMANAANSYWNVVAARKNLNYATEAESRGLAYLDNVEALAAADRVPRNDLNEAKANLAQRTSSRIIAEQQLLASRRQLALDMGIDADEILARLPEPTDDFPAADDVELPLDSANAMSYYLAQALENRADYLASLRRSHASGLLVVAAKNGLQPKIDLSFSTGYAGLQEGTHTNDFFMASGQGVHGPNVSLGVAYTFAGANHAAKGAMLQAGASARQSQLQSDELARNISASVAVALAATRSSILRLGTVHQSVDSYQAALAGEREKYKQGIGSIISILTIEDKLNSALADQVQAQLAYASALIQFRFATGTLNTPNTAIHDVQADTFLTFPFVSAKPRGR
jgi:outer membrane protein